MLSYLVVYLASRGSAEAATTAQKTKSKTHFILPKCLTNYSDFEDRQTLYIWNLFVVGLGKAEDFTDYKIPPLFSFYSHVPVWLPFTVSLRQCLSYIDIIFIFFAFFKSFFAVIRWGAKINRDQLLVRFYLNSLKWRKWTLYCLAGG